MTLKTRLMLTNLVLPLLLLAMVIGVVLVLAGQRERTALETHLTQSADLLAPSLGTALADGDHDALAPLAGRLLALAPVRGVSVQVDGKATLLELGTARDLPSPPADGTLRWIDRGRQWILQTPLPLASGAWLTLDIDASSLMLAHYQHLAIGALALLLAGLLLFGVTFAWMRHLTQPLEETCRMLDQLTSGIPPAHLPAPVEPELAALTHRINRLADHQVAARDDLEARITQVTNELQTAMETIEVQNIELDLVHRRALEANRAESAFLANMSHEIRTPLNGIAGFCRLLGRSRLEPRQREWLEHVQRACDTLLMLVNDILDYSKIEAGCMELESTPLDMVALVDEVLGLQAPLAQQKDLQLLGLVYDDVPPTLRGDPLRIRQVLTNLVNNAVKFTDHGEVIVRVMVEQARPGRIVLRITVSDSGIGMTEQARQRLFQAFRQAEASHSRKFGGTGLGLAISRQLVEQMGGEIGVTSTPGQGTTFFFTLMLEGHEGEPPPPEMFLDGEQILLEEPHAPTRWALRHLLTRWGAQVIDRDHPAEGTCMPSFLLMAPGAEELAEARLAALQQRLDRLGCPALLLVNTPPLDLPEFSLPHGGEVLGKPLSRAALFRALQRQRREFSRPRLPTPTDTTRLLVVDDTDTNRRLLQAMLEGPGLEVTLAASGEEALALARDQAFDMVLIDIRMPGLDGIATTRALRRLEGCWQTLPIIAVTAHVPRERRHELREAGFDDALAKPLDHRQLTRLLQHHLGVTLAGTERPVPPASDAPVDRVAETELPVVDLTLGTRLAGGREALAQELLAGLAASLGDSEAAIRTAVDRQDDHALLDALHALNGACRYCGVPRLGLLAETLETRLRASGMHAMTARLEDLFTAMREVQAWQTAQPSSTTNATARVSSSVSDR